MEWESELYLRLLTFTHKNQKQGFVVSIEIDRAFSMVIYGFLKWVDKHNHMVSSPIVISDYQFLAKILYKD